ncbi:MAG: alpha/beta hydrolase [Proteobacteria bacterium]|nr:alpha/beta hydrolase [Pseudomonadota bacterium]MBS0572377.1 alpha/beta hydrolase [Pseudomonadota bacterium]
MSADAPFYADVAEAPAGQTCRWLATADGVRIRAAFWRQGERGTVLLFPGRTEYAEKYGPAAGELAARGFAMATLDWRGQGLADRPLPDRATGHVRHFGDYQKDVAAFLGLVRAEGLPQPFHLIAHSMGGQIGLRALLDGLPVRAAAFSAPMWGLHINPALRPLAWLTSGLAALAGKGSLYAPGTSAATYVSEAPFADNVLTRDPAMYAFMQRQIAAHPDLILGGPSMQWLNEALRDCLALSFSPSPRLPGLTMLGALERVVDPRRIRARMERWPGGELDIVAGAEHEVMMERPEVRRRFYDRACALFAAQG